VPRSCNPRGFAALERWIAHADIDRGTPLLRRIWPRVASAGGSRPMVRTGPSRPRLPATTSPPGPTK
jgi:hypothetical protein